MEELLKSLQKKCRVECEEAHRQLVCALNGLAGIHIIRGIASPISTVSVFIYLHLPSLTVVDINEPFPVIARRVCRCSGDVQRSAAII